MTDVAPRLGPDATVDEVVDTMTTHGYAVVERYLDPDRVAAIVADLEPVLAATPAGRNDFEGFGTKRIYALFAKTRAFDDLAIDPLLLGVLDRVLGHYQLSAPTGIQIGPGEPEQPLHRDDQIYPIPDPHPELVVNTMWALCDFTEHNGATRLVPASHGGQPKPVGAETIAAEMPAGCGGVGAGPGDPPAGGAPGRGGHPARTPPGAAGLQHLSTLRGLRRRPSPPPSAGSPLLGRRRPLGQSGR